MKNTTLIWVFSLVFTINLYSQKNCQNFESFQVSAGGNALGNWVMFNDNAGTLSSPPNILIRADNGGKIISASDNAGATFLINTQDFDGNWTANGSTCFCLDIKLISDGSGGPLLQVSHGINIFQNLNLAAPFSALNPGMRFVFTVIPTYNETSPWRRICLPIYPIGPNDPLPSNSDGQWTAGNLGSWNASQVWQAWNDIITNVTEVGFFVDATSANQNEVIGLDNICIGCEPNICCPKLENLIANFDFSNSRPPVGFNSQYTYDTGLPSLGSLLPGEYEITNPLGASTICPGWPPIKDHSTCPTNGTGDFMIVNGSTGQTTPKKLVWEQTINNIQGGKEYKFCAQFKNLPQCCFDVKPKIDIKFIATGLSGVDLLNQVINVTSSANCEWMGLNQIVTLPSTGNITIQIWLDESSLGDGNDLAFDDIAFMAMTPLAATFSQFNIVSSNITNTTYNITATPTSSLPTTGGYGYFWEVCEVDNAGICTIIPPTTISNPQSWWTFATNFSGYNGTNSLIGTSPGVFQIGKSYKIRRGVWCECNAWSESSLIFKYDRQARIKFKTTEVPFSPQESHRPH